MSFFGSRRFIWSLFYVPPLFFNYGAVFYYHFFFLSDYLGKRTAAGKFFKDLLFPIYAEIVVNEEFFQVHNSGWIPKSHHFVNQGPFAF